MPKRKKRQGFSFRDSFAKQLGRQRNFDRGADTEVIPLFAVRRIAKREQDRADAKFRQDYHDLRLRCL